MRANSLLAKLYASIGSDTEMAWLPIAPKNPSWATAVKWAVTHAQREVATEPCHKMSSQGDNLHLRCGKFCSG